MKGRRYYLVCRFVIMTLRLLLLLKFRLSRQVLTLIGGEFETQSERLNYKAADEVIFGNVNGFA